MPKNLSEEFLGAVRLRVVLFSLCVGLSLWSLSPFDPDLGWHLFGGALVSKGIIPSEDLVNSFNPFWMDYHWLGQRVLYALYQYGSYELVLVCFGLIVAALFALISDTIFITIRYPTFFRVTLLSLIPCGCVFEVLTVRPQIAALTGIALTLRILHSQIPRTLQMTILFALTAILANIHVYWVFIPFLWFGTRVLVGFLRPKNRGFFAADCVGLVGLALAGAISPYGFKNYALLLEYLNTPEILRGQILEFRSALQASWVGLSIFVFILLVLSRDFSWHRARVMASPWFLTLSGIALSIASVKFLPLLGLFSLPLIISSHTIKRITRWVEARVAPKNCRFAELIAIGLALSLATLKAPWPGSIDYAALTFTYPYDACQKIAELGLEPTMGRSHVRVLTHFNYGGWCRFAAYEANPYLDLRVTTDNRTQWVPKGHYEMSIALHNLQLPWNHLIKSWAPDAIVVFKGLPLAQMLRTETDKYTMLYNDRNFMVFKLAESTVLDSPAVDRAPHKSSL